MRNGDPMIDRLQCGHCGAELPVMGRSVVFRCGACRRLWAASGDRLGPVGIDRAQMPPDLRPEPASGEILHLPFWVVGIDLPHLEEAVSRIVKDLRETHIRIAEASLTPDDREPDPLLEIGLELIGVGTGPSEPPRILSGAATALPPPSELDHFLRKIGERGIYRVFVPAFDSPGEQVRLGAGRLMTQRQPALRTVPSDGSGRVAVPVIQAREALALARYVFFSVFPSSVGSCAGFMDRLEVAHSAEPLLVEFPFTRKGSELEALVGGFHIPARLVSILEEEPSPA